jgi:hypothetical protein
MKEPPIATAATSPSDTAPATNFYPRQLRFLLISTGLLLLCTVGQVIAIHDLNSSGKLSGLALIFKFASIFLVPTAVILTGAIMLVLRRTWRKHERIMILGLINLLIALNLVWFFVSSCTWSQVFGLALRSCS